MENYFSLFAKLLSVIKQYYQRLCTKYVKGKTIYLSFTDFCKLSFGAKLSV